MNDRELLEAAAKVAGAEWYGDLHIKHSDGEWRIWSPLTDDGDALRLAGKLHLEVSFFNAREGGEFVEVAPNGSMHGVCEQVSDEGKRIAAIRRAIVRAAAELAEDQS